MARLRPHLTYANVVSTISLFVVLGGTGFAALTLSRNSVTSRTIKNGQVRNADLGRNAVATGKVRDGSLLAKDFKAGQLPAGARGPAGPSGGGGSPTGRAGGDLTGTYPNPTIAAGKVDTTALANGAVTRTKANLTTSFTSAFLENGWAQYGPGTYPVVGYAKDASGFVHLRGVVANNGAVNQVITTLPAGFRPGGPVYVEVTSSANVGSFQAECTLFIDASGTVQPHQSSSCSNSFISLENVTFFAGG